MSEHDRSQLGAYALGALEPAEAQAVRDHLAGCADCSDEVAGFEDLKAALGEVPPEAFLDGPPADGDLLLQRTVREARATATAAETGRTSARTPDPAGAAADITDAVPAPARRSRWLLAAAAVVVIASAGVGAGVLVSTELDEPGAVPSAATPAGTRQATVTDARSGATMATTVEPRNGWSWVNVQISGLAKGYECELRVVDKSGKAYVAGSWLISDKGAREGAKFSGGVVIPVEQVRSVDLVTLSGKRVVSTPL